jgi:hypothetical protein
MHISCVAFAFDRRRIAVLLVIAGKRGVTFEM